MDSLLGTSYSTNGLSALSFAQSWHDAGLHAAKAYPLGAPQWSSTSLQTRAAIRGPIHPDDLFHVQTKWDFYHDELSVTCHVRACAALWKLGVRSLPRIGVRFALNDKLGSQIQWLGRGPDECYPDRKRANAFGLHGPVSVDDMHVPYVVPGESGGRADCVSAWLQSEKGYGVQFIYEQLDPEAPKEMPLSGSGQPPDGSAGSLTPRPAGAVKVISNL